MASTFMTRSMAWYESGSANTLWSQGSFFRNSLAVFPAVCEVK